MSQYVILQRKMTPTKTTISRMWRFNRSMPWETFVTKAP
jgi:hypothetical protein